MKKATRALFILSIIATSICVLTFACGFLILEPKVKINGFVELDKNRLNLINNTISITGQYNEPILVNQNTNGAKVVSISTLPEHVKNAFIAVEDKRFYKHKGVDWQRVAAAALNNLKALSFAEGASTISQQLIKNTHLKSDKTINRKLQEIRIARDLERSYDKEQILEMYLNILYFGNNVYGIETASNTFFNKAASSLSISEAALLAGIINNPSKYNPYRNEENAIKRRDLVLNRMYELKYISSEEYNNAMREKIILFNILQQKPQHVFGTINEAQKILEQTTSEIYENNYSIYTSINVELSKKIQNIINCSKNENVMIKALVIQNNYGEIIADCSTQFIDTTDVKRSPGSIIKPLLCYAPALDEGIVHTITPILDKKTTFGQWQPSNFNNKYYGWTSVEQSLIHSLNVPAIKLLNSVGIEKAKRYASNAGLSFTSNDYSLSLALGCMQNGATLRELVGAYSIFANNGYLYSPKYIQKIVDKSGNIVFQREHEGKQVYQNDTAYLITDTLKKCAKNGTAKKLRKYGNNIAAKTGTVGNKNGNTDAYCIAYTPKYTVGVWLGAIEGLIDNSYSGGNLPTEIAGKIISFLGDKSDFIKPSSVVSLEVDQTALNELHKVLLASNETLEINTKLALFSKRFAPKEYSAKRSFMDRKSFLDDFYNFDIINSILN